MFINQLSATLPNLLKINHARYFFQPVLVLFLAIVISGQGWADEKLSLLDAARDGNLKQVELLISQGADVNQNDDSGYTPLMWAARYNHLEITKQLVKAGALTGIKNSSELSAIQIASRFNNFNIARYLTQVNKMEQEKQIYKNINEQRQTTYDYDRDQDGYIDFAAPSEMPPGMLDFSVMKTMPECVQGENYQVPAARWALSRNKWRVYKISRNSIISARRRSYHLEVNFFHQKDKSVMGLRYLNKKGNLNILKRIARRTLRTYEFFCSASKKQGQLVLTGIPDKNKLKFSIPACGKSREKALSLAMISLRENNWDNIGVKYGHVVTADYSTNRGIFIDDEHKNLGLLGRAMIEFSDDWTEGSISSGYSVDNTVMTELNNNKSLKKFNKRIKRQISRSYKLICK